MSTAMIPTRYKEKLPKALSYPLGAEAISDALAGATQVEQVTLEFRDRPGWRASDFRRLLREGRPYTIFAAQYQPADKRDTSVQQCYWNAASTTRNGS